MAAKLNAGDYKRGDLLFVDPFQVIVKEELRGRHKAPSEEQILQRALSMMTHGQIQPVDARKNADKQLVLNAGFTRTAAARLIRTGFVNPETGVEMKDEAFMLQLKVVDANDQEAFERNIVENAHRNETTPIDDAHNQRRLRDQYGKTDAEITRLYGYSSPNKVGNLAKLLLLDEPAQNLVHEGNMSVKAALDLLDLPAEKQAEALALAMTENGKVSGAAITDAARDHALAVTDLSVNHIISDDNRDTTTIGTTTVAPDAPKYKPITMKNFKDFLSSYVGADDSDPALSKFAKETLDYMAGKRGEKAMRASLTRLLEAQPTAVEAE